MLQVFRYRRTRPLEARADRQNNNECERTRLVQRGRNATESVEALVGRDSLPGSAGSRNDRMGLSFFRPLEVCLDGVHGLLDRPVDGEARLAQGIECINPDALRIQV